MSGQTGQKAPYYQDEESGITLYCGDCLDVLRSIETGSAAAFITDPPYGIDYQSARRTDKSAWKDKIANDGKPFIWWLHDAGRIVRDGGSLTCFCRWDVQETFRVAIDAAGFDVRSQVIWDRLSHGMGDLNASFAPQHDVIWFATKGRGFAFTGKRPKSVIQSMRLSGDALSHPNEKPVDLMAQLISAVCQPGDLVIDCFIGSGTTIVAAKQLGCRAIGIEVNEAYLAIAAQRLRQGVLFGASA